MRFFFNEMNQIIYEIIKSLYESIRTIFNGFVEAFYQIFKSFPSFVGALLLPTIIFYGFLLCYALNLEKINSKEIYINLFFFITVIVCISSYFISKKFVNYILKVDYKIRISKIRESKIELITLINDNTKALCHFEVKNEKY